jgi:hypothetical protein
MRVSLLYLCALPICWSQDSVTRTAVETPESTSSEPPDADVISDGLLTSTTTLPTTATAGSPSSSSSLPPPSSSSSQLPQEDELVIGDEVPATGPGSTKEAPVSDVIEEPEGSSSTSSSPPPSPSEAIAGDETESLDSSLSSTPSNETAALSSSSEEPVQAGPFIDLLGKHLLSLEMIDPGRAQLVSHYTNEALANKRVVGLYFSADWYACETVGVL